MHLDHAVLFVADGDRSIAFYRDGLGLDLLVDREFTGPWTNLFGVESGRLRAMILGDATRPELGQIELVTFAVPVPSGPPSAPPVTSTVVLSFHVDLDAVLPRLEAAGGRDLRRSALANGATLATIRDPDGILVELLDVGPPKDPGT